MARLVTIRRKRNPIEGGFVGSLVEGMGSGAGMAISAGLLAPLVVDRAAKVFNKLGLIRKNPGIKLGLYEDEKLWDVYELGVFGSIANRTTSNHYRAELWTDLAINAGEWYVGSGRYRNEKSTDAQIRNIAFNEWWGLLRVKPGRGMTKAKLKSAFNRGLADAIKTRYPHGSYKESYGA